MPIGDKNVTAFLGYRRSPDNEEVNPYFLWNSEGTLSAKESELAFFYRT